MSDIGMSHAIRVGITERSQILTSVDDFPAVQVRQAVEHAVGNFAENLLSGPAAKFLDFFVNTV